MIDDDQPDPNPYQSPAWSNAPTATNSGLLTDPIHIKGAMSLAEVQQAYPFCTVKAADLVLRLLYLVIFVTGFGPLQVAAPLGFLVVVVVIFLVLFWQFFRRLLAVYRLRQLWHQQRGIFAQRQVTITNDTIEIHSADTTTKTPWADYAGYRSDQNTVWLYVNRQALKRRREQGSSEEARLPGGVNLHKIDIFPRLQFEDDGDWERFQWVVKHKLNRKFSRKAATRGRVPGAPV